MLKQYAPARLKLGRNALERGDTEALFESSATAADDFKAMAVTEHSELSYYRGLSLMELGRDDQAALLFKEMKRFTEHEKEAEAKIDYFATSLPLLLVFEDDLDEVKNKNVEAVLALAEQGLELVAARGVE